jgi:hypothetical protein
MKTSDTTEGDSETPKLVDEGEIQIEFSSDYFNCPNIWAKKKKVPVKSLGQYSYCLIIQNI